MVSGPFAPQTVRPWTFRPMGDSRHSTFCLMGDSPINVSPHGRGAKRLWTFRPTFMGRNFYGQIVYRSSAERNIHGANCPLGKVYKPYKTNSTYITVVPYFVIFCLWWPWPL